MAYVLGTGSVPVINKPKTIDDYKADYDAARAKGDSAGMQAANDGANAIRKDQGVAQEKATADIAKIATQSAANQSSSTTSTSTTSVGAPSGYQGSASGVQGYTNNQQADIDKMNRNSIAYYETTDPAERQRLHEENETLAAKLGSAVVFNTSTGKWSGRADQPQSGGDNFSSYIEDMNKAQLAAALSALRNAYEKNVLGLNRAQAAIAPEYQSARNEAAGQSELQKRNFAEYAAANGLSSGAGGQAQLAFTNTLQGNLSNIAAKEASTMADLELQRSQMESDYENAIAQAEAQGNFELAQQLYQEKVRQDENVRQQMQWQAQMDLQNQQFQFTKDQAAIGNEQWSKQYDTSNQQYNQEWAYKLAQDMAQWGNFEGYKALGYTDAQIQSMKDTYASLQKATTSTMYTSGGDKDTPTKYYDPSQLFQAAYDSGLGPSYIMMNASAYGVSASQIEGLIANYSDWANDQDNLIDYDTAKNSVDSMLYNLGRQDLSDQEIGKRVTAFIDNAIMTEADKSKLVQYVAQLMKVK